VPPPPLKEHRDNPPVQVKGGRGNINYPLSIKVSLRKKSMEQTEAERNLSALQNAEINVEKQRPPMKWSFEMIMPNAKE